MTGKIYKYIAIHPDEDGNCITFLTEEKLQEIFDGDWGDVNFLSWDDLTKKGENPQYWNDDDTKDIMLINIENRILIPKIKTTAWSL